MALLRGFGYFHTPFSISHPFFSNCGYLIVCLLWLISSEFHILFRIQQVPKFGNWENEEDVPYTAYFEKAKKARKTKAQFPDPSSNNELPFQAPEEADIKHGDSTKSEPERRNTSRTEEESRVSQEEVNMKMSSDSLPNPRRTSRQSGGGSDRSFDNSPMHSHTPARSGNKGNTGSSPMSERKVSSEAIHGPPSSTPGRSKLKQVPRGDETVS